MFAGYQPRPVLPARLRQQQLKVERWDHLQCVVHNKILFTSSLLLFFCLLVISCSLPIYFSLVSILCFGWIVSQKAQRKRIQQAKPWLTSPILPSPHLCHQGCSRAPLQSATHGSSILPCSLNTSLCLKNLHLHKYHRAGKTDHSGTFSLNSSLLWSLPLLLLFVLYKQVRPCMLQSHNHVHMHPMQHVLPVLVPAGWDEVSVFIYIVLHLGTGGLSDFLASPACVRPILSCTDVYGCYSCMTYPWVMPTKSKLCLCIRTTLFFRHPALVQAVQRCFHIFSP